jgi:RNA polymerase sigma factor (TIGR02999 family)
MSDITQILSRIQEGDKAAAGELLPLVYEGLRRLASQKMSHEAPGQTMQATALVHEAYIRLVGKDDDGPLWDNRGHFYAAAAEAMRRILVENARRKRRLKRGAEFSRRELDEIPIIETDFREDLIELDEALVRLAAVDETAARLVHLRYFAGMSIPEAAPLLGISPRTADRLWAYARAWLRKEIEGRDNKIEKE